jgi:N-acetylmuramoyl-L-alanine amidase
MASVLLAGCLAVAAVPTAQASPRPAGSLRGMVVGVDPGHNGRSYTDPAYLDHPIWNGREEEDCDTNGTETDGGYTEARFNWNVATFLVGDLRAEGARVVLTRIADGDRRGPAPTVPIARVRRSAAARDQGSAAARRVAAPPPAPSRPAGAAADDGRGARPPFGPATGRRRPHQH